MQLLWIFYDNRIYTDDYSHQTLLSVLKETPKDRKHICLIGHNDSISSLASYLTKESIALKKGHLIHIEVQSI